MPPSRTLHGLCRITEHLYLSNIRAAADDSIFQRFQITCVINVCENQGSHHARPGVEHIHIPVTDAPLTPLRDHFEQVADKIDLVGRGHGHTLVHCHAGVSRSATLCIVYLMKHLNMSLLQAYRWVKSCRPIIRPNNGFWKQLIDYEKELRGCTTVQMMSSPMGDVPDVYQEETKNMLPF